MHLRNKITLSTAVIGLLLLILGVSGGWYVLRLQRLNSQVLDVNVSSIRAAEEMEMLVRETRHELERFLLTRDRGHLAGALEKERNVEVCLEQARMLSVTEREKNLMTEIHRGLDEFFARLRQTPNIYHLVELKDTYHRYVVMLCSEARARILEVNLGSVTAQLWNQRLELRQRAGREWTKEHYQNHRRNRTEKFIKEKVEVLERLMSAGGHTHLILAGHPSVTNRVRSLLPKHLAAKLVDSIPASAALPADDVVETTIASFLAAEENESRAAVEELVRQLRTGGLAVAGTAATHRALYRRQADVVVIAKEYEPGFGWACDECGHTDVAETKPDLCPECGAAALRDFDIKGAIVLMAERLDCTVEVVKESGILQQLGGVGCLLRYRLSEDYT